MQKAFTRKMLHIDAGKAISLCERRMVRLQVVTGRIWVTAEGVGDDYWLNPGEEIEFSGGRRIVIETGNRPGSVAVQPMRPPSLLNAILNGYWLQNGRTRRRFGKTLPCA